MRRRLPLFPALFAAKGHARDLTNATAVSVVRYLHTLWGHFWLDHVMATIADYGIVICIAAFVIAWLRNRSPGFTLQFVIGAVVATALDFAAGHFFHDRRPFVVLDTAPLLPHSSDNGFPSDHSVVAGYIAMSLVYMDAATWALVATLAAFAIGVARVYCLLHWPGDIVAGWLIGIVSAVLVFTATRTRARE